MNRKHIIKYFQSTKDVLLFLAISIVILEGWKLLDLDAVLSPLFSQIFHWLIRFEFRVSAFILKPLLPATFDFTGFLITFPNRQSVYLYEGCSGLKQIIQFTLILLIYPGCWRRKGWFIPVASAFLILAAVIHFIFLCVILYHFPDRYNFMHDHISRWFFFVVFFILWVLFTRNQPFSVNKKLKSDVQSG